MKKLYVLLITTLLNSFAFSQASYLIQNFNSYNGDSANFLSDYYVSWNSPTGGMPSASFYSSAGNVGLSPNSYKFGIDSATIITPAFAGADSLTFWYKGNGTGTAANKFLIYESADSATWSLMDSITSFPSVGATYGHGIDTASHYLKFVYHKAVGNVAFDDLYVFKAIELNVNNRSVSNAPVIYPNPSNSGTFMFGLKQNNAFVTEIKVYSILGKQVFEKAISANTAMEQTLDLSEFPAGIYFATLKTDTDNNQIRLVISK